MSKSTEDDRLLGELGSATRQSNLRKDMDSMIRAGTLSAGITSLFLAGVHFALNKYSPRYVKASPGPKTFVYSSILLVRFYLSAEHAHLDFMDELREEYGKKRELEDRAYETSLSQRMK